MIVSLLIYPTPKKSTKTNHHPPGVSHRPSTTSQRRLSGGSPGPETRSSLAALLFNLNSSAVSSISATINGSARLVERGSDEEKYYREKHLENHTFETEAAVGPVALQEGDGGRECFVAGEEVRVLVVGIRDVRIADWRGAVRDWVIEPSGGSGGGANGLNGSR